MPKCGNCSKGAAKCKKCNGTGQVNHGWIDGYKKCDHCHGSGKVKCGVCNGKGWL